MRALSDLADLLEEAFPAGWDGRWDVTPGERLRTSLSRRDETCRRRLREDLRQLQGRGLCDMQLSDVIAYELGCHLRPAEMGLTAAAWLDWLARELTT